MKFSSIGLFGVLACLCATANATTVAKTGVISGLQGDSHTRPGFQDVYWVQLAGAWGGTCGADWVYFNAKDNPHLVATVITARAMGSSVTIYVDDALPKVNGAACQVFAIAVN
jgi:hypothetical protein